MWCYVGLSVGDFLSGFLSHWLESRKKAVFFMMAFTLICSGIYLYTGIKICFEFVYRCNIAWIWNWILGHVCDHWSRTVWYQFESNGRNYGSKYGTWYGGINDNFVCNF